MSKSKDIRVDPSEVIEEYGADPMRLFLLSVAARGEDTQFSYDETGEMARRLNILWNVFRFPLPYMRMDDFDPTAVDPADAALETVDEWVLSRLQSTILAATDHFEDYEQEQALDALLEFVVEDVSRYYVQVVRERMWEEDDTASKTAAYATIYEVLLGVVTMLAPFAPYVTEEIYGHLTGERGHDTVHMCDWPTADRSLRTPALEGRIATVRAVEEAGSHARQRVGRKLRWPVRRVVLDAEDPDVAAAARAHEGLLADRLNARCVEVLDPGDEFEALEYSASADMSVLGPAFGDRASEVMTALNEARVESPTVAAFEDAASEALGESVDLSAEMLEFVRQPPADVAGAEFDGGTVYVDASLTADIESEGYAREIIRRVQEMRKDLDLDLEARIHLDVAVFDERVARLVSEREDLVAEEVRADRLGAVESPDAERQAEIEGVRVDLAVRAVES
jgi:isoleucyl-tRNA synthetase